MPRKRAVVAQDTQPRPLPAGLVAVACRKCGRHLVDVIAGASVRCPACLVWTPAELRRPGAS